MMGFLNVEMMVGLLKYFGSYSSTQRIACILALYMKDGLLFSAVEKLICGESSPSTGDCK